MIIGSFAIEWPDNSLVSLKWLLVIAVVILAGAGIWWGVRLLGRLRHHVRPLVVFFGIAMRLELTWPQSVWLLRVAHRQGLSTPLTLLLSRTTLEHYAMAYGTKLTGQAARQSAEHLHAIRGHLFGH